MKTVGQILSIERNSKRFSIDDISIELKISKSIIIDLENGEIRTIRQLKNFSNRFLYTSRKVDKKIFELLM